VGQLREQAALGDLYRVSDLYDPDEQTSRGDYLNVRHIMRIKAQGGIER